MYQLLKQSVTLCFVFIGFIGYDPQHKQGLFPQTAEPS
jgi:hypothetical protein